MQDQYLNRGEWRLLEEKEREWDDIENLTITVELVWEEGFEILPTKGHVPTHMIKHIYFALCLNTFRSAFLMPIINAKSEVHKYANPR